MEWLALIAPLLLIAGRIFLAVWEYEHSDERQAQREAEKERRRNVQIHNDVSRHDVDAVRRRLRGLRAER